MTRNAEFDSQPAPFEIHRMRGGAEIEMHDNIRQDGDAWYADIYWLLTGDTANLEDRVRRNYAGFLARAKTKAREEEAAKRMEETAMTIDDLAEIAADQEYRLCLLELGV